MTNECLAAAGLLVACASLAGCSHAPAIEIIGSFFPVWMLCLTIGVILTFVARNFLRKLQLETEVGPLALFYPALIILFTAVLWLVFFR